MKDRNENEYRVGDIVQMRFSDGRIGGDAIGPLTETNYRNWMHPERHEIIRRADGSDPRKAAAEPAIHFRSKNADTGEFMPEMFCGAAPFKTSAESAENVTCPHCRAELQKQVDLPGWAPWEKPPLAEVPKYTRVEQQPDLPARYKLFRETVERVVREEAPNACVVTDWSPGAQHGASGQVWVDACGMKWQGSFLIASESYTADDYCRVIRNAVRKLGEQLGARAMGRKA